MSDIDDYMEACRGHMGDTLYPGRTPRPVSRWRKLDTWPTWAWVVVIVVEVTIGLLAFKFS